MIELPAKRSKSERLLWLDIARVLAAVMILGIHWLRPGYTLGLFGESGFNLIVNYQYNTSGLRIFHDVFIAGFAPTLATWLTNVIGLLGGFGWEAVNALIIISGFSLAVSQLDRQYSVREWIEWLRKRVVRILVPYYLVALPLLIIAAGALLTLHFVHNHLAQILEAKLHSQLNEPLLGVALGHIFLFDPWGRQWSPHFFAPAWWFIPAILLAYLVYPFLRSLSHVGSGIPLLLGSAIVTSLAYIGSNLSILFDECWYFIVLHELFNFSLGIVLANLWLSPKRPLLERGMGHSSVLAVAFVLFVLGNIANWNPASRPIASMLFGPGLTIMLVCISKRLEAWRHAAKLVTVDPYDLYLVHQPFAFPIALISKVLFHSYAVFIGWFLYLAVAAGAARLLSLVQRLILARSKPKVRAVGGLSAERAT